MGKKAMCWAPSGKREDRRLKAQSLQGAYVATEEKNSKEGNPNNGLFWTVRARTNKKGEITRRTKGGEEKVEEAGRTPTRARVQFKC
jgi:hypothetical protein